MTIDEFNKTGIEVHFKTIVKEFYQNGCKMDFQQFCNDLCIETRNRVDDREDGPQRYTVFYRPNMHAFILFGMRVLHSVSWEWHEQWRRSCSRPRFTDASLCDTLQHIIQSFEQPSNKNIHTLTWFEFAHIVKLLPYIAGEHVDPIATIMGKHYVVDERHLKEMLEKTINTVLPHFQPSHRPSMTTYPQFRIEVKEDKP